jgi:hypothetical protein
MNYPNRSSRSTKNRRPSFDISTSDWVIKFTLGQKRCTLYQTSDGKFFLHYPDEGRVEAIFELEVRRLISACAERSQIEELLDEITNRCDLQPPTVREAIVRNSHRNAREAGLFRAGALPDIEKYLR